MRFILGLIIGAALTIGGAYLHDTNAAATPAASNPAPPLAIAGQGRIVNWDVVDALARQQVAFVKDFWDRTFGG
ncbi:MAG: hypothetical protein F9K43_07605 [Bauldia sp.]|nr:MAG: hypothetical protein F9K43_07605 [Bauldia sp.]